MKFTQFRLALGAAALALPLAASAASFIVMGAQGARLDAAVAAAGGAVVKRLPALGAVIAEGGGGFQAAVEKQTGVAQAMPNLSVRWQPKVQRAPAVVNDALDPPNNPPGSIDGRFNLQWGHAAVKAVDAWNAGQRGAGARVAVLDGGFNLEHPDIATQVDASCSADMTGEGLAYGPNSDDATGIFSHGMHVAGTIAAAYNNAGTIGVAPDARLCLVKVLFNYGSGSFEDVAEGLVYAADQGVDIINMSLGASIYKAGVPGEYTARDAIGLKTFIDRAVAYAYQRGVLVVVSAGNSAINGDKDGALIHTPSDAPHAMSVSATAPIGWALAPNSTSLDNLASYSNFGRSVINVSAPGGDAAYPGNENCLLGGLVRPCYAFDLVFSTGGVVAPGNPNAAPGAYYYWSAGTSMAAPHVAGVAALAVGKFGKMHPSALRTRLEKGADDLGQPGNDPAHGAGRVNAVGALR